MIYLFIITFVAELIITVSLASNLFKLDRKVCLISEEIATSQDELAEIMTDLNQATVNINEYIQLLKERTIKYRNKFVLAQLKSILQTLLLITFKPKYKKLFLSIKVGSKFIKKLAKRIYMLQ